MQKWRYNLPITRETVPEFTVPDMRYFRRSYTVDARPKVSPQSASSPMLWPFSSPPRLHTKIKAQSLPVDDTGTGRAGRLICGSRGSSCLADSPLPLSPVIRPRERTTGSNNWLNTSMKSPTPMTQRYSSDDSAASLRSLFGSVSERVKGMLPAVPAESAIMSWWETLPSMSRSPLWPSFNGLCSGTASRSSMLRLELENRYGLDKSRSKSGSCSSAPDGESATMSRSRTKSDGGMVLRQRKLFLPKLTTPLEELDDRVEDVGKETNPEGSIMVSVTYKTNEKKLMVQVHSLTCVHPKSGRASDLVVELTMYPDRQRRVLSAPSKNSTGETLLVTADFDGVKSVSLASRSLMIRVYSKGLIRKIGRLLYQASISFCDMSLAGDAVWVPLKPQKVIPSVTVCLCYRPYKNKFLVTVVKAKDLKKSTVRKDSYVEVNLFRGFGDKARMQTVRTKSYYGGRNPVYKEAFSFELPSRGLASVYTELSFTVRRRSLVRADEVLGRVTLSSEMLLRWKKSQSLAGTLDEAFRYPGKVITQTHFITNHKKPRHHGLSGRS